MQGEVSNILLDQGVNIPMIAPLLFRIVGKKTIELTIRRPYWGTMVRISKLWLSMGVKAKDIATNTLEDDLLLIQDHGLKVATIVALGFLRGRFMGRFAPMLGRWLLWRVSPILLTEAAYRLVTLSRVEDFTNTIRLIGTMNVTRSLSPEAKGS